MEELQDQRQSGLHAAEEKPAIAAARVHFEYHCKK
jgi:hypothetical protein